MALKAPPSVLNVSVGVRLTAGGTLEGRSCPGDQPETVTNAALITEIIAAVVLFLGRPRVGNYPGFQPFQRKRPERRTLLDLVSFYCSSFNHLD